MQHTNLIVPGFHGGGEAHWPTWLERRLDNVRRVRGIAWEAPLLARWAAAVRREIDESPHAVWIVAHSFGGLASVVAATDRPDKVAGMLLVAPTDPECFSPLGVRDEVGAAHSGSVAASLPVAPFGCASSVVASSDDSWVSLTVAARWAERWGSDCIELGPAGHINIESGHGPWPLGFESLQAMQHAQEDFPHGTIGEPCLSRRGRHGALARIRHRTRFVFNRQAAGRDRPTPEG